MEDPIAVAIKRSKIERLPTAAAMDH